MKNKKFKNALFKYGTLFISVLHRGRLINLFKIIFSSLFKLERVFGLPFLLQIEPTNRCNFNCIFCFTGAQMNIRKKQDMNLQSFKDFLSKIENQIIYLSLYNLGEPLFNKHIYKMIEYARRKKIFVRLSTNGYFLEGENIYSLVYSGLNDLIISLDYIDKELYKSFKGVDCFAAVVKNIRTLVEYRGNKPCPFITIQLLATKNIENDLIQFRELVNYLNVDRGVVKPIRANFPYGELDWKILPSSPKYTRKAYLSGSWPEGCLRAWVSAVVLCDGSVIPCCFDMRKEYDFGNVFKNNFCKIWNNDKYTTFRRKIINKKITLCHSCSSYKVFF